VLVMVDLVVQMELPEMSLQEAAAVLVVILVLEQVVVPVVPVS
jgi:hypothetical protein